MESFMIFHPRNLLRGKGRFVFPKNVCVSAHPCLNKLIIKEFWHNFTFQSSELCISPCEEYIFALGNVEKIALEGEEYSINVTHEGVCVCGKDEKSLLCGFMTLLDRFKAIDIDDEVAAEIECCQIKESALVSNRMVHFCIFPETELWEIKRFVRLCGALKYTHIILEFWGMLQYDCMKELSWKSAFTKEDIRPIISEANDLGLEVIPMFNHWGHASACRVMHGKHVVLDQNPSLQTYFSEDGWCWDIGKPKVKALLRRIRNELIELCGEGKYIHIGCDEAYKFDFTQKNMDFICDFINEISDEMAAQGRRVIAWGDMFLYRYQHYNPQNNYSCNAPTPEIERYMLEHLSRKVVVADWQYNCKQAPVETVSVFQKAGFESLLCPWDCGVPQMMSVISTVKEQKLSGFLHTTWHTLSKGMPHVVLAAVLGFENIDDHGEAWTPTGTAALLRKVMPVEGDYRKAGWCKFEVDGLW